MQEIWLDQDDAQLLQEGEEVTLMDWGNAIVQVPACSFAQRMHLSKDMRPGSLN